MMRVAKHFPKVAVFLLAGICFAGFIHARMSMATRIALPSINGTVDMSALGDDWETICVIAPYSANEQVKQLTGLDIDIAKLSRVTLYDHITLLIAKDADNNVALFDVVRSPTDFSPLEDKCWPRSSLLPIKMDEQSRAIPPAPDSSVK